MDIPTYRFRIIAGPRSGQTFTVGERGALIGRSENCDVIILDPSLSRHHCRFFLRDGLLWVADLKSANSTDVDGMPIQEAPLWKDRRVTIGDTVILVESDTGAKRPSAPSAPTPRPQTALTIAGTSAAIILLLMIGYWLRPSSTPQLADTTATVQPPYNPGATTYLAADYYRIQADTSTIHTMHFQILPPDLAMIHVEDLAAKREMRRTVTIPRYQADLIARHFADSGFFSLASTSDATSQSEVRISAFVQDRQHTARNPLHGGTASFRNLAAQLEETAAILFGHWIKDFSDANLLALATQQRNEAHAKADVTQANRHDHLYDAILKLEYALWLLQPMRPAPDLATEIQQTIARYRDALDAHIRHVFSEADRAARRNDHTTEIEALQLILAQLPDERDLRYRSAADRLAAVPREGGVPPHAP